MASSPVFASNPAIQQQLQASLAEHAQAWRKDFAAHLTAIDTMYHVSNAAWGVKCSSTAQHLALNMEEQQGTAMRAVLDAVPKAVDASLSPRLACFSGLADSVSNTVGAAVVPGVVHGLSSSDAFKESVQGAVQAVVDSPQFKEKVQGMVQAAVVESPQFLTTITAAVKSAVCCSEFLDALVPKVAAALGPGLGQLMHQQMPMLNARGFAGAFAPGGGGAPGTGGGHGQGHGHGSGAPTWGNQWQ
jgi:hypothetical protein